MEYYTYRNIAELAQHYFIRTTEAVHYNYSVVLVRISYGHILAKIKI